MKYLICGTQTKKNYKPLVFMALDKLLSRLKEITIIEGCCPDSADVYAEEWAVKNNIKIEHFPANKGNYLKRNIEMVEKCDCVICFYDGYSYGSAHTVTNAVMRDKPVFVIKIR